jgi:hypothetical protein
MQTRLENAVRQRSFAKSVQMVDHTSHAQEPTTVWVTAPPEVTNSQQRQAAYTEAAYCQQCRRKTYLRYIHCPAMDGLAFTRSIVHEPNKMTQYAMPCLALSPLPSQYQSSSSGMLLYGLNIRYRRLPRSAFALYRLGIKVSYALSASA